MRKDSGDIKEKFVKKIFTNYRKEKER